MIGRGFRLQQRLTVCFPFRVQLADTHFFFVRQTARHWAGRDEDRRQMPKRQRRHHQARDNLVAHAEVQRAIKHVV